MLRIFLTALLVFSVSGCVSAAPKLRTISVSAGEAEVEGDFQRQLVLEQQFLDNHLLETLRFNIGHAAVAFCPGRTRPEYGFAVANKYSFDGSERALAVSGYGFGERLRVLHVIRNTPAYKAGLRSGDYIVEANGETIPTGASAKAAFRSASSGSGLNLVIETPARSDSKMARGRKNVSLAAVETCRFDVELTESHKVGAYAMAGGITITKGMMWFAQGDELAFVLSHELVHVIRKHARMIGKYGVKQKDVEAEADYMGLYIMARAGYEIGTASKFWRRIAAYFPRMRGSGRTHPQTSYRFVAMEKTMNEINSKIVAGRPLLPGSDRRLADASAGS